VPGELGARMPGPGGDFGTGYGRLCAPGTTHGRAPLEAGLPAVTLAGSVRGHSGGGTAAAARHGERRARPPEDIRAGRPSSGAGGALDARGKADGKQGELRAQAEDAARQRDDAVREFQAFAATGLRVAVTSLEIPDGDQPPISSAAGNQSRESRQLQAVARFVTDPADLAAQHRVLVQWAGEALAAPVHQRQGQLPRE